MDAEMEKRQKEARAEIEAKRGEIAAAFGLVERVIASEIELRALIKDRKEWGSVIDCATALHLLAEIREREAWNHPGYELQAG